MPATPKRRLLSSRRAAILTAIRRLHLYSGLAMLPWVLLYAISGLLFNHPSLSGGSEVERFTVGDLPASLLAPMPQSGEAASAVVEQLRQGAPGATVELTPEPAPEYVGSLGARGMHEEHKVRMFLSMNSGNGAVRVTPTEVPSTPSSLRSVEKLDVASLDPEAFEGIARDVTARYAEVPDDLALSSTPKLRFGATIDGEPWVVTFDPKDRTLEYERADEEPMVRWSRVLARLHMTHVYPASFGVAWIHAFIVDLTILCLVLWCVTGLVMWWQLRRLRRIGWVFVLSGLAAATWVLVLVWPRLVT